MEEVLAESLEHRDPAPIMDFIIDRIIPNLPTRLRRGVWVRTIRRLVYLGTGQASRTAILNRRHRERNPTARLPRSTSAITRILSAYTPEEAQERVNEVLQKLAAFVLNRFPHLRVTSATDEVDWASHARPTSRETNDLYPNSIGGKDGEQVFRCYVTTLIFAGIRCKIPARYEFYSHANPVTGKKQAEGPGLTGIIQRALDCFQTLPRFPKEYYLDRGFETDAIQTLCVAATKAQWAKGGDFAVVSPARAKHYGTDQVHMDPAHTPLDTANFLRAFRHGPMSPAVFKALAPRFARTKVKQDGSEWVGIFRNGDPGAPEMVDGLTFIVERRRIVGGSSDVEAVELEKEWYAFLTYTTHPNPSPKQAVELSRRYRDRNYIESVFHMYNWNLERSGIHHFGARVLVTGLQLVLLGLWAVLRVWWGFYVKPGRFEDYTFFEFLAELSKLYLFPDEPPD